MMTKTMIPEVHDFTAFTLHQQNAQLGERLSNCNENHASTVTN